MLTQLFRLSVLAVALLLLAGCAHRLEVKNLRNYQTYNMSALEQPLAIGIVPAPMNKEERRLVNGIGYALKKYSPNSILPYAPGSQQKVDVVADISIKSRYYGSGMNFLINFPGFLVWAPAWNGYIYNASYTMDIRLTRADDGALITSWPMTIDLDLRHAEIDRTWTEISWFEVGAIAFIGGVAFIQYDDDVTPLLIDEVTMPLGNYIAEEIIQRLNNHWPKPVPPAVTPVPDTTLF